MRHSGFTPAQAGQKQISPENDEDARCRAPVVNRGTMRESAELTLWGNVQDTSALMAPADLSGW